MKRSFVATSMLLLCMAMPLAAENVEGHLIDQMCSAKLMAAGAGAARYHTKECALSENCKSSGYGVVTADGQYWKFDEEGDRMAVKFLETVGKDADLKVTVNGEMKGDVFAVTAIQLL